MWEQTPPPFIMNSSVCSSRNCSEKYSKAIRASLNQGTAIGMLPTFIPPRKYYNRSLVTRSLFAIIQLRLQMSANTRASSREPCQ